MHAIVSGIIGITIFGVGSDCLNWKYDGGLAGIVASWGFSPVLMGVFDVLIYLATHYTIMGSKNKLRNAMWAVTILYGLSTFVIFLKSAVTKKLNKGVMVAASAGCCVAVGGIAQLFLVPYILNHLPSKTGHFLMEDEEGEER